MKEYFVSYVTTLEMSEGNPHNFSNEFISVEDYIETEEQVRAIEQDFKDRIFEGAVEQIEEFLEEEDLGIGVDPEKLELLRKSVKVTVLNFRMV